jgi:hypothetical protein
MSWNDLLFDSWVPSIDSKYERKCSATEGMTGLQYTSHSLARVDKNQMSILSQCSLTQTKNELRFH